ncbi:MAG: hypothetical protein R2752_05330 [Vicinamibacterales bacterium]
MTRARLTRVVLPTRWKPPSSSTRSSFTWSGSGRSAISSRKRAASDASRPTRSRTAPVNARTWPNISALEQVGWERAAVDRHERRATARRVLVQRPGHDFLAGAALAGEEHRGLAVAKVP